MHWLQRINWLLRIAASPSVKRYSDRGQKKVGIADAFFIKERLKPLGFRWDGINKLWWVPEETWPSVEQKVNEIIGGGPATKAPAASPPPARPKQPTPVRPNPTQEPVMQPPPDTGNVQVGNDGVEYVCLNIPYQKRWLQEKFKQYGFKFNWGDGRSGYDRFSGIKAWIMPLESVLNNPEIPAFIKQSGIAVPELPASMPSDAVDTPEPEINVQQPVLEKRTWMLGKKIGSEIFIAASKFTKEGMTGWDWEDMDTNDGQVPEAEIQRLVEFVPEGYSTPHITKVNNEFVVKSVPVIVKAETPDALLDPLKQIREDNERAEEGDFKPDQYQQKVIEAFTQTDKNIMMSALAGTGKTSMLRMLAKLKADREKQSGKELRWDYLVFNAKNKVEGTEKFKPHGIGVSTSHGFLGEILNNSRIPGVPSGKDSLWVPETKKKYGAHTRMALILDNLMHGSETYSGGAKNKLYQAKLLIQKIAALCKQFAINPMDHTSTGEIDQLITRYNFDTRLPSEEETKAMEDGQNMNMVDYRADIIKDVQRILTECLPGRTQNLHATLSAQRQQTVDELEQKLKRGQWTLTPRQVKSLERKIGKEKRALYKANKLKDMGRYRDHDDTLWYSALPQYINQLQWPQADVIMVDEVQDFNECQRRMLEKLAANGARLIAVGDSHQSIYRFRGADSKSFGRIEALLNGLSKGSVTLPLPENHRCGANIIEWVNNNTEVMKKLPPEDRLKADKEHTEKERKRGQVDEGVPYDDAFKMISDEWNRRGGSFKEETAFIARTNAPLANAAMQLMKSGIDFEIIGKDFSADLARHIGAVLMEGIDAWAKPPNPNLQDLPALLTDYKEKMNNRWRGQVSREEELKDINEFTDLLVQMASYLHGNNGYDPKYVDNDPISARKGKLKQVVTALDFRDYLYKRFGSDLDNSEKDAAEYEKKDKRKFITLTTAHRSKGMEYSRVLILAPELFPHPKSKGEEELVQEHNAWYVSCTRAERHLIITVSPDKKEEAGVVNYPYTGAS